MFVLKDKNSSGHIKLGYGNQLCSWHHIFKVSQCLTRSISNDKCFTYNFFKFNYKDITNGTLSSQSQK